MDTVGLSVTSVNVSPSYMASRQRKQQPSCSRPCHSKTSEIGHLGSGYCTQVLLIWYPSNYYTTLLPWWWKQHVTPKRRWISCSLHNVTFRNKILFSVTSERRRNFKFSLLFLYSMCSLFKPLPFCLSCLSHYFFFAYLFLCLPSAFWFLPCFLFYLCFWFFRCNLLQFSFIP